MKRLVLIDAHAIIHRAYHALPRLTGPDGKLVNAVYGFSSILLKMLRELKPDYACAAFDLKAPTFRHAAFEAYKAHRVKAPDELYEQIPMVREILRAFGIPVLEKEGYEADDIIGTIVKRLEAEDTGLEIVIVTGDLDTLQLVSHRTKVFTMKKGITDTVLYDAKAVQARFGIRPGQLTDFKGLRGDPSDNIPGVKGIGEKTASQLLQRFGSIESLYTKIKGKNLKISPAVLEKLTRHEETARLSKELGTIHKDVPITVSLGDMRLATVRRQSRIQEIFGRLGFQSLLRRLEESSPAPNRAKTLPVWPNEMPLETKEVIGVKSLAEVSGAETWALILGPDRKTAFISAGGSKVFKLPAKALARIDWDGEAKKIYAFDIKSFLKSKLNPPMTKTRDLLLIWYLLNPGRRSYELNDLLNREFRLDPEPDLTQAPTLLFRLGPQLEERLDSAGLTSVYSELEAPLTKILVGMEELGIGFDPEPLSRLSKKITQELKELERKIYRLAGSQFNINSSQQLTEVLFEKLKLDPKGLRRTEKSGRLSTRESELAKLRSVHPIVAEILRYRELFKLKSTYVDALPKLMSRDGRIHTTWNQTGTATGRLSSQNPNLQNIPIRSEYGREIRKAFQAGKGFKLVAFDYSQLELRIAGRLAQDGKMIEAFRNGLDIHSLTAAEVNNIPLEKVTPELRYQAKALNFGILYGMGPRAFAESAGISRDQAEVFIEEYFRDFEGVARFVALTKESARDTGYTQTAFGRKRFFPEIVSTNRRLQAEAERQAVNHPVQGTAADIVKKAMIETDGMITAKNWAKDVRLLLQIHDELVFEVRNSMLDLVIPEIRKVMEGVWPGEVLMKVEVKQGVNWGELE